MTETLVKRISAWLPTVLVLLVVLLAGSRLIVLSLERHADDARAAARAAVNERRIALESQLAALAARSVQEARRATPGRDAFRFAPNGSLVRGAGVDATLAQNLASEWAASDAAGGSASAWADPRFLGPTRQGSQWIIAARAAMIDRESGERAGWAVAFADLDQLLANARVGRLVSQGYDFTLGQVGGGTQRGQPFANYRAFVYAGPTQLEEPIRVNIRTPQSLAVATAAGTVNALELAVRPREGWYPPSRLASQIGLLALMAWLISFGIHDLIHHARRLQTQLADSRTTQVQLGEQLLSEIEERQGLQKSFDHSRYHDAFTGLPNRRFFMDQLDRGLREVRTRRRQGIAVALIDIDRFKLINETLGHAAGDELMVQIAHRFQHAAVGPENVLARWEGDQFALLLFDMPTAGAALDVVNMLQGNLREPFELRRHKLSITASMGVTCADSGMQRAEDLLREADIALSVAKRTESVKTIAYLPTMGGDAASLVSLEADLHLAVERKELRLLFQPIVELRSKQAVGAEALLRWEHPVEGLLTPDKFLAIAEEAGLMVPITRWIIARVCTLAGEWRQRLGPGQPFYVSINLSATTLRDPYLADFVASTLARTQAPASALKFEITEAGLINNVSEARAVLRKLHDMGIELMLDDFGTGYSALNHLELFPFDFVKIDRPFVSRLGADPANTGIMAAVVQIAASLGLKAIAEVIETQAAAQALQKMGCDYGQGYYFGAPVVAEEALQRLRGRNWSPDDTGERQGPNDESPTLVLPVISR